MHIVCGKSARFASKIIFSCGCTLSIVYLSILRGSVPSPCHTVFMISCALISGDGDFKSCALNETCARKCVRKYTDRYREIPCGRAETRDRLCVDYGVMHAFFQGCSNKDTNIDIRDYRQDMIEICGVSDPPSKSTDTGTTTTG